MNNIIIGILIGLGSGLVVFPIGLFIVNKIRNTFERRAIKRMIKMGKFLTPIDKKDYDSDAWQNQRYGNIDPMDYKNDYNRLNEKLFKNPNKETEKRAYGSMDQEDSQPKNEEAEFMVKIGDYVNKMIQKGFTREDIFNEFKKKNYSNELIRKIFENYGI